MFLHIFCQNHDRDAGQALFHHFGKKMNSFGPALKCWSSWRDEIPRNIHQSGEKSVHRDGALFQIVLSNQKKKSNSSGNLTPYEQFGSRLKPKLMLRPEAWLQNALSHMSETVSRKGGAVSPKRKMAKGVAPD